MTKAVIRLTLICLMWSSLPVLAQDADENTNPRDESRPSISVKGRFGFDPTFLQFGGHVFFPDSKDTEDELDLFPDGKLGANVQLAGIDTVGYFADGKLRVGINAGVGVTSYQEAGVIIGSASLFLQVRDYYRIEAGYAFARSGKEGLTPTERDRSALFAGVTFPTNVGDALKSMRR